MTEKNKPVELTESELDQAKGGIGLLLPAVQKVREAAARPSTTTTTTTTGGLNVAAGDYDGDGKA